MAPSSARFKQEIQDMDKASDVLLALRPVSFRYKPEIDPEGVPQFGLVAEEVEKIILIWWYATVTERLILSATTR